VAEQRTPEQWLQIADRHDEEAERLDALDMGSGECEVAAAYHATRASEIRASLAKEPGHG
jgi:hypothetical protein